MDLFFSPPGIASMAANKSVIVGREERWIQHYSSGHYILLVGEGDFSFSLCLAMAFGSGINIVATSLDSYEQLITNYKNAKANLRALESLGASLLHGVDATMMNILPDFQCRRFHRIIYNFPHAGFHSKEDDPALINMHRSLVYGFFRNARTMLMVDGEIHLNHKVTSPYNTWGIENLATKCDLFLVECPVFSIKDYPGYVNKRGAGSRCDEPFPLGECGTFKFKLFPAAGKNLKTRIKLDFTHKIPAEFQDVTIFEQRQLPLLETRHPLGYDPVPMCVEHTPHMRFTADFYKFGSYLKYVEETYGGNSYALRQSVSEALVAGFRTYVCSVPGATWSGYIGMLEELHNHNKSILRSEILRQMLACTR